MAAKQLRRSAYWACPPLLVLLGCFGFIGVINWDYEAKFFQPALIHGQSDQWLGLILLAVGALFGLGSSFFAFLAAHQISELKWWAVVLSIIVSLALFIIALSFIALGPAAITMREQMG